jgi:hypothetical protein
MCGTAPCTARSRRARARASCGGRSSAAGVDARDEAGAPSDGAAADGRSPLGDGGECAPYSDAAEPQLPAFVEEGGAVPLGAFVLDLAIVQCSYFAKCSPFAPFVVAACIEGLRQTPSRWNFIVGAESYDVLGDALVLLDAGAVHYDPAQADACLRALQVQSCHGFDLWKDPSCDAIFPCAIGGIDGGAEGGPRARAISGPRSRAATRRVRRQEIA